MKIKNCQLEVKQPHREESLDVYHRLEGSPLVRQGFGVETAVEEARRCLGYILCESCDLCRLFCPDLCITRDEKTNEIKIDYCWCKGCGICAETCPKGAIKLVLEES